MQEQYNNPAPPQPVPDRKRGANILTFIMLVPLFWGILFIFIPVVFIGINNKTVKSCTVEAQGYVVSMESKKSTSHSRKNGHRRTTTTTVFAPVVTYTDENGTEHTEKRKAYSNPPICETGDTVRILYDPNDFGNFYLPDNEKGQNFGAIPFVMIGVGMIIFAVAVIIKIRTSVK